MPNMFEMMSALQKEIRRGKEYEAMYWAVQLESMNDKALWNRLLTIASEDISIANPSLISLIETLRDLYYEFKARKKEDRPERLFLAHAILALSKSEKSRIANDLVITVYGEIKFKGKKLKIPLYAIDKHTSKGKKKGMEHFLKEGIKLVNESRKVKNLYKERAKEILLKHGEP